ncbi:reverse transcriptase domain-containing protein [Tanacetum coccineum]
MHTRASNSELVEPLPEPEHYDPMDDEPMWVADRVVALTPGSAITIPETANEFAIKGNALKPPWSQSIQRQHYKNFLSWSQRDNPRSSECRCWCNTQPNPKGHNSKAYQPPQSCNEHVNAVFTRSGKSYNPPVNPNDQQDNFETPINFDSDDEDDEPTPQPKTQNPKPVKETPLPNPYKPKITYPQRLRKEKMEAQYGKFLDMIRAVRINVPFIDVLAGMPNYGKFLKELISNKHKIEQISAAFLSDESSAMIQNKVPPKLRDPRSFLIPCNFSKTFSCNALADLGTSINLMPYSLYAKLSLETLKPTKMSVDPHGFEGHVKMVVKLTNFKKDATLKLSKATNQEWYEDVDPEVTRSQDDKVTRWRNAILWVGLMISHAARSHLHLQYSTRVLSYQLKYNSQHQYGKFLDMIRAIRINVPFVDVLAGMHNYGKFLKELISNKHKIEQIFGAFLSDETSAMIQNKVPPKLGDPGSFLIPCNFNKTFSYNALADLGASINLMPYSLYAKLSLETLKPTKISVRLADISFQYPVGIAENMLVEVGKFTFLADFVILEMEEDSKVEPVMIYVVLKICLWSLSPVSRNLLSDTKNEAVFLMMFPLSLPGEAKTWLDELNERTIETWDELETAFISRFFPPTLFDRLLGEIRTFSQHENESLTDAWLRMKEMLHNCHGHNLSKGNIIKKNYHGLSEITQEVLNAAAGGIFLYKTPNQVYQLLEDKVLLKLDWAKNQNTKSSLKKTVAFADEGNSNSDSDKIMARMDAMTIKMDAQHKELQSRAKQPTSDLDDEDMPINNQPNPRGSKAYQPPQARNEHVNAVFTRSGKSYNPPDNPDDQQNNSENTINFDSDDEDDEPTPQQKNSTHKTIIRVKHKQLNLGVGTERMIFNIDTAMKHSYSNDDTCFSIDVIDEILEEDFDSLLDKGSKILHSIKRTLLKEEIFSEFDEFMAMTTDENSKSESDTEEPPFEKITINTDYKIKTSLKEPPTDLELKPLPDNLKYVFLEEPCISCLNINFISTICSKQSKLVSILKKHKEAFAWKTTDIPGICPSFCKHKIQLLDDKKPVVQKQRRLNPNKQEVVKKEIVKLLDTGIIYPIFDSAWVSPIHSVPKKGGITVVTNKNDELVPTRTVTGWRVCINYRKLNEATAKDHFPLPFMDQMLKRLTGNKYFCFLDGFSGYFQIPIDPMD